MNLEFKNDRARADYHNACMALRVVTDYFVMLSNKLGVIPVITRIEEPVANESGVHLAGRAVDFRDEIGVLGPRLYNNLQRQTLLEEMSTRFQRKDGKPLIIHHAAQDGAGRAPYHFHCQIPANWKTDFEAFAKEYGPF